MRTTFAFLAVLGLCTPAVLAGNWNEAIQGDISGNRLQTSFWALDPGTNLLNATTGNGSADKEFLTIRVPTGWRFSSLVLDSYVGDDPRGFIGFISGSPFWLNPAMPVLEDFLGYTHFGPADGDVGRDILPRMGSAIGAGGFLPPLGAGDYSFWIEQGGPPCTYQFTFLVIPAPLLTGDANGDGVVGTADYAIWAANFGQSGGDIPGDFDGNGSVGASDYALWAANFGKTLDGGANVPEPSAGLLAAAAAMILAATRLRRPCARPRG